MCILAGEWKNFPKNQIFLFFSAQFLKFFFLKNLATFSKKSKSDYISILMMFLYKKTQNTLGVSDFELLNYTHDF